MRKLVIIFGTILLCNIAIAQNTVKDEYKMGWFINPEIGAILHTDHLGKTLGGSVGIKLFKKHLKVGVQYYGRPGPINSKTFTVTPTDGQVYKGQTELTLRADHGSYGLFIAPVFDFIKFRVEVPISVGTMGGGFYLLGDDRLTPDGDRVSVWEDRLMNGMDAGFSTFYEFGTRIFVPLPNKHVSLGLGLHYTIAPTWETYADPNGDLYNNRFRIALILGLEG